MGLGRRIVTAAPGDSAAAAAAVEVAAAAGALVMCIVHNHGAVCPGSLAGPYLAMVACDHNIVFFLSFKSVIVVSTLGQHPAV